jgi:hypothetical protein
MNILIATTVNELEIYALLGYNAASNGNFLTFRDNLSVPSLRGENPKRKWAVQMWSLCRHQRTSAEDKWEKGKEIKCNI